jgi:hypothetical protein
MHRCSDVSASPCRQRVPTTTFRQGSRLRQQRPPAHKRFSLACPEIDVSPIKPPVASGCYLALPTSARRNRRARAPPALTSRRRMAVRNVTRVRRRNVARIHTNEDRFKSSFPYGFGCTHYLSLLEGVPFFAVFPSSGASADAELPAATLGEVTAAKRSPSNDASACSQYWSGAWAVVVCQLRLTTGDVPLRRSAS